MADTVPTNIDLAAATATTPKLARSVEEQAMEKYIREAGRFLEEARLNPGIAEGLAKAGYDDVQLTWGMDLQDTAWNAFCTLHGGNLPDPAASDKQLDVQVEEARDEFEAFRLVARACFTSLDARLALHVVGDVPEDLQRFVNAAHSGYAAAGEAPYAQKLSKRGYPAEKLKSLSDALDSLAALEAALDVAEDAAEGNPMNTEERDKAYIELKEYMKEIKGVARAVFRKQPEVLATLGV